MNWVIAYVGYLGMYVLGVTDRVRSSLGSVSLWLRSRYLVGLTSDREARELVGIRVASSIVLEHE